MTKSNRCPYCEQTADLTVYDGEICCHDCASEFRERDTQDEEMYRDYLKYCTEEEKE